MEKKKAIKIATATAIAASAFTAVAPAQSEAATSLTSQITKAKATIKKPYDTYVKATTKPASAKTVKSQIAAAKKAKTTINAAIKKAKLSTTQKNAYYAQIKAYDVYITRAQNYVNATSISVVGAKNALATAIKGGNETTILAKQAALKSTIAKFKTAVAKVYGKQVRALLLSYYATPAQKLADSVAVKITDVSALDSTNKYLQVTFNQPVSSLSPADIQIKDAKKGDIFGVYKVTLAANGKTAQVELYENTDNEQVLEENTEYTVTVKANGQTVTGTFYDAAFTEGRVTDINVQDGEFTIVDDDDRTTKTITVLKDTEFDYQAALGDIVRVWYNADNELVKYQIVKASTVSDAIEVTKADEIKIISTGKKYDTSTEEYDNTNTKKFKFYVDGVDKTTEFYNGNYLNDKFNFAKVGFDKTGDIEYVNAYTLNEFLIVDHVEGNEVVGIDGNGTSGSFDAEDATIVKDGKTIALSDLKKGDVFFLDTAADNGDGYAEVLNKTVTGKINEVYDKAVSVGGNTYKFIADTDVSSAFGGLQYSTAVYLDEDGKTDLLDSDAAEELQAAGDVTIYTDYAGNVVYISGGVAQVNKNEVSAILTDDIQTKVDYGKAKVQVEALLENDQEKLYDITLENLKTISVNGVDYDISTTPDSTEWSVGFDNPIAPTAIVLTAGLGNPGGNITIPLIAANIGAGNLVKAVVDSNGNPKELQFFTTNATTGGEDSLSGNVADVLEAGDNYFIGQNAGSKKLLNDTVVYVATNNSFDADDITVTTWGEYKGSDILDATAIYNDDNEVEALVVTQKTSTDKVFEEAVVTGVLRNTDNDVVQITAYVNGEKQTLAADKINNSTLAKGDIAILEFDKGNNTMVQGVQENGAVGAEYTARVTAGLTNVTLDPANINVGEKTVKIGNTTYKLANNGAVIDAKDLNDIKVKSLSDLKDNYKNVTAVLDENNGVYVKYFIYGPQGSSTPTPSTVTSTLTGNYTLSNLSDKVTATLTNGATYSDYQVQVLDGATVVKVVGLSAASTALDGAQLGLAADSGKEYTVNVVKKSDGSVLATKKVLAAPGSDFTAPTSTIANATYNVAGDTITLTGTNFTSVGAALADVKSQLDWTKLAITAIDDVPATTNPTIALADVTSAVVTNDTTLTITLTGAKATALETAFGTLGATDTLTVTAGFTKDASGNVSTTDALAAEGLDD